MLESELDLLMKKELLTPHPAVNDPQALALHECISILMRKFRIEPGLLAGSAYADLHANDVGLFEVLAAPGAWSVRRIAQALGRSHIYHFLRARPAGAKGPGCAAPHC